MGAQNVIPPQPRRSVRGAVLHDVAGRVIGTIADIVYDDRSGRAQWYVVTPRKFLRSLLGEPALIPVRHTRWDGGELVTEYDRDTVLDAPRPRFRRNELDEASEGKIEDHFRVAS